jgi:hypothetical protein
MLAAGVVEKSDWLVQLSKNLLYYLPCTLKTQQLSCTTAPHVALLARRVCCELRRQKILAVNQHAVATGLTSSSTKVFKIISLRK